MLLPNCEVNLATTLLEGWLQSELTVGKMLSPQNWPGAGPGTFQASCVQRKVTRCFCVTS